MTFYEAADVDKGAVVWLMTGAKNTDHDFERYVASLQHFDGLCAGRDGAAFMIVDAGNPAPSSSWRKKIADASAALQSKPVFALVSPSPLIRGVVTAVNWLRPPAYPNKTFADIDSAIVWVEATLGRKPPLGKLIRDVRAQAATARPPH